MATEKSNYPAPQVPNSPPANDRPSPKNDFEPSSNMKMGFFFLTILAVLGLNTFLLNTRVESISYNEFLQHVETGDLENVVISDTAISGDLRAKESGKPSRHFSTAPLKDEALIQKLYTKGISFRGEVRNPIWDLVFSWVLPGLLLYWIWTMASGRMLRGAGGLMQMTKSRAKIFMEKEVKVSFADVAGIDEAKEELREVVSFLQDPKRYSKLGGRAPKGVLLIGPPGTGKTLMARAVAGEAKVPFFSINGSEFVEMFVGLGAARVRDLFEQARKQAPCILFIDEIDALGKSRALGMVGTGANDEKEQTLNQLLAEMDGFDPSEGVILLAATNRPEILDPALLRAGRFDRQVLLSNPDQVGRQQILAVHIKKIKIDPETSLQNIASMTSGFSGADLANLVNEAALTATRRSAEMVSEDDFIKAIERIVAGIEKKGKVMNPKEKDRVAYHELGHATVALELNAMDKVQKVSVIPRGMGALGYTLQRPTEDRYLLDEEELSAKVAVLLGGRAAEKMFLGTVSTGAADDLAKATDLTRAMVVQFGMSERLGLAAHEGRPHPYLQSPFETSRSAISEKTASEIDEEIKRRLDLAFQKATACLEKRRAFITEAHEKLMQQETLNENEISLLWQNKAT
jgi:cell division protease FtsH